MKVGVITILHVGNYGAEFQANATVRILRKLGFDAEIIDYLFYKNPSHIKTKRSTPLYKMSPVKRAKEFLYPILENLRWLKQRKTRTSQLALFDQFHKLHTPCSKIYQTIDDLYRQALGYDAYIVGSDQVWNPGIYSSLLPYLLDFAPPGKRRLSYASSFGVTDIPSALKPVFANALKKMDAISVREPQGKELVRQLCGREAQCVLDPTLLLNRDDWRQVAANIDTPERYILVYTISPNEEVDRAALALSAERKIPVLRIALGAVAAHRHQGIRDLPLVGPGEFLTLIDRAEAILTNSFHGTAFAVNFGKEFYSFILPGKQNNSRLHALLHEVDLEDHLHTEWSPGKCGKINSEEIFSRLGELRTQSIDFLRKNLQS